jgi:hypothetical protein
MMEASPTAKDERPETGAFALSGPHHLLQPILAEIPPVTSAQMERMYACMRNPDMHRQLEPVSLLFGLAVGAIIGFYIRDSFTTGRR